MAIAIDGADDLLVTGSVGATWFTKWSSAGDQQWHRIYPATYYSGGLAVAADSARNVIHGGWTRGALDYGSGTLSGLASFANQDGWIIKAKP